MFSGWTIGGEKHKCLALYQEYNKRMQNGEEFEDFKADFLECLYRKKQGSNKNIHFYAHSYN